MADFEIIEADFQQYYHLDVTTLGFRRYARLLANLPLESRFVCRYSESKDWSWDKEVQSRILYMLDIISCQVGNMTRKKGTKPRKPDKQFQPDYVEKAKTQASKKSKITNEEKQDLEQFFKRHNSNANKLERVNDGS